MSEAITLKEINSVLCHFNSSLVPVKANVLVLDDSPDDIALITRLLDKLPGMKTKVTVANTIDKAIRLVRKKKFDVAIVDFLLQMETGTDLVNEIGGRFGDFPCILTTGMLTPEVMNRSLHSGVMAFLDKELLTPNLLESTIRSTLNNWKIQDYCFNRIAQRKDKRTFEFHRVDRSKNRREPQVFDLQQAITDAVQGLGRNRRNIFRIFLLDHPLYVCGDRDGCTSALASVLQSIDTHAEIETDETSFFDLGVLKIRFGVMPTSGDNCADEGSHNSFCEVIDQASTAFGNNISAYRVNEFQTQIMISLPKAPRSTSRADIQFREAKYPIQNNRGIFSRIIKL